MMMMRHGGLSLGRFIKSPCKKDPTFSIIEREEDPTWVIFGFFFAVFNSHSLTYHYYIIFLV